MFEAGTCANRIIIRHKSVQSDDMKEACNRTNRLEVELKRDQLL
jgi:hypothetical protein